MEGADPLIAVAEVSLGLAGFAGVIAALHIRERWHPLDAWRTLSLLGAGFGAMLLSLLPFALDAFHVTAPALWRICSGVMITLNLAGTAAGWYYQPDPKSVPHHFLLSLVFVSIVVLATLVQLLNLFALPASAAFGAFLTGLILYLVYGAGQFCVIIFLRPPG